MVTTIHPVDATSGAPAYGGRMLRQVGSVAYAGASASQPFDARSGVRPGTSVTTVTATSTVWTVSPHAGLLDFEAAMESGPTPYAIDAAVTGAMTAANATLPRIDIVWVRQDIPLEDGASVPAVVAGYTAGTAASTPAAPSTPARCMVLASITVPASGGGSPTVIWRAPYTVAAGGILPVPGASAYPAAPYVGQVIDDATIGGQLRYNGTAWIDPSKLNVTIAGTNSGITSTGGLVLITFGVTFAAPPLVMVCNGDAASGSTEAVSVASGAQAPTTTTANARFGTASTGRRVNWTATGDLA